MNQQKKIIAVLLCAVFFLSACSSDKVPKPTVWGRFQEPFKSVELSPDSGIDEITIVWQKNLPGDSLNRYAQLAPAFTKNSVVAATPSGNIRSIELASSEINWATNLDSSISFAVGVGGKIAVVGHSNGYVTALNIDTGDIKWTSAIKYQISAIPAVSMDAVVIRTSDGRIIGLDPHDGNQRWILETERPRLTMQGDSQPTLQQDIMLIGLGNGKLIVGNSITGRLDWEIYIGNIGGRNDIDRINDVDSPPILNGSTAYAAAFRGYIKSINMNSAETIWETQYSTRLPMSLGKKNIYAVSDLGELAAFDIETGAIAWNQDMFRGHGMSPPVTIDGRVLVGDSKGRLHSLDPLSGQLIDTQELFSGAVLAIIENGQSAAVYTSQNELALIDIQN
ncbi:MAG: PQQ-binding-like beta-propeller repeat protein [Gammaproteobacteria bacterium]|nr:PQQ-binding-like beta-propeller repeat protein [Gammaproteobacteria bacterium]MCY4274616.1 PQQ-binding-like beta-propeller repeat protein [Gammaproteobacteria bacterium]